MKLIDVLKDNTLSISFEVFPPKSDTAFQSVKEATEEIAKLKPAFVSVTYGADGGTRQHTLDIAENIKDNYGIPTVAHLTCVASTKRFVEAKIKSIKAAGIENIMALRGDLPQGVSSKDTASWDYRHATDLIKDIKRIAPEITVGGACYPEVHPESANQSEDIKYLKEKVECGCEFLTTQMFFDNNLLYNFLYKTREAGITVPIVAGIMPITNANQVEKAIRLSGSLMPQRFKSIVDKFGSDPDAMKQAGIAYATDQIIDLFANNITNVHVYTMNKPDVAAKILENLSSIVGK